MTIVLTVLIVLAIVAVFAAMIEWIAALWEQR